MCNYYIVTENDRTLVLYINKEGNIMHSTAQHSTAQHSTAQHSTAQHSTAQHSTAQHSTIVQFKMGIVQIN
ncbi:hypothetical protein THUN1656_16240 [Rodentibacter abscessus]|uniref:hypothetical protein n=1 Tax=Rodentibacter abscessus TaxID=3381777 RepID=UPI00399CC14F